MNDIIMANDLLNLQEHVSCGHCTSDYRCIFTCCNIKNGDKFDFDKKYNHLIFILEGQAIVNCNDFIDRRFTKDNMFLVPKSTVTEFTATADSKVIVCMFEMIRSACDKFELTSYCTFCKEMPYNFDPVRINSKFRSFLEQLTYYLEEGVRCEHFHELKLQEMFLIIRWLYSGKQIAQLLYPLIGRSLSFKELVLENYLKVGNVSELASLAAMSRSNFDIVFKKVFDMPVKQWMLKQKAKHVKFYLSSPDVNISDIMISLNFNSPTHFTRFCKQQFGCTPSEMIFKLMTEKPESCIKEHAPIRKRNVK